MNGPLDSITSDLVSKALDVSLSVHQSIANNIANSDTSGYRPLRVNFEAVMQEVQAAVESGAGKDSIRAALDRVDATPEQEPLPTSVLLDQQMVQLVRNTTHYEALLNARDRMGDIMKLAIKGGQG